MHRKGQMWPHCEAGITDFVNRTVQVFRDMLDEKLDAIYLHGSLAMGCFYPPKSDIDILVLVSDSITSAEHRAINEALLSVNDQRPIVGSLELSVVMSSIAKRQIHPMPYELHFSEALEESIRSRAFDYFRSKEQVDPDLAAHFMVTKNRGVTLYGESPDLMLGDISWHEYMAAVLDDLEWILDNENIIESPFYGVLNSCRVLQMLRQGEGTVSSKEEGALWALENLPQRYSKIIADALECYRSQSPVTLGERKTGALQWDSSELFMFRDYVRNESS